MANHAPQEHGGTALSDWTVSEDGSVAAPAVALPFAPGTMLAGRYRLIAPLGRGGMGEVYRADDLRLGQPVALKFVRGQLSPEALKRLYAEVALGRQVSHPSVCRLYDIVEVDGHTFLSMEYVDGEDLSSLLSRIGRLPADKAVEIFRDLCSGLAAMHDRGIVHRDLKPANVMLDGRGRARLTDFGLAITTTAAGSSGFAGTPAYMAPEQLSSGEVTARSDLYALALIFFEMLTGRRFFEGRTLEELLQQHREAKSGHFSSVSRLVDSSVERALQRCLDEDPQARPASARLVLASLPGHDPLEAAVAAGETPSPEAVAAGGTIGDLSRPMAWTGLLAALAAIVLTAYLMDRVSLVRSGAVPKTPELLAERARAVLLRLGQEPARHVAYSFDFDRTLMKVMGGGFAGTSVPDPSQPARELQFFYRQSPRRLIGANRDSRVTRDDPPPLVPGMAEVLLDAAGRLRSFQAVPPRTLAAAPVAGEPDWSAPFAEAGLDPARFQSVIPRWVAPVDTDRKAAWEGDGPYGRLRVEAAGQQGRLVWFSVLTPAAASAAEAAHPQVSPTPVGEAGVWLLALAMPVGGVLLARRNLRLGRGDRPGAFRVALFVFATYSVARLFRADHVGAFGDELWLLIKALAYPSFWALQVWLLYLALEPFARRRWPHVLISWKRLLAGQAHDPLVGRDVLLGGLAGTLLAIVALSPFFVPALLGQGPTLRPAFFDGATLTAFHHVGFRLFVNQFSAVLFGMVYLFILVLFRLVLRREWLAMAAWCLMMGAPLGGEEPVVGWTAGFVRALLTLLVLRKCGLLGLIVALFFMFMTFETQMTLDFSSWYSMRALPVLLVFGAVLAYGFRTSLAGKPALGGALLDD
jgi:hypothetical protein